MINFHSFIKKKAAALALLAPLLLGGISCATGPRVTASRDYNPPAYRPTNPNNVRVKVSLSKQMTYVMEGDRPLLVTACSVGTPDKPTPMGNFRAYNKIPKKRSGSYGFGVQGDTITPSTAGKAKGRYVGFPMAYWVEFKPAYGFHQGYVWPMPRTHGCIRLHKNAAPKFFALVNSGTPINIAPSQPEDATIGANHVRPTDYNDPDPPASITISDAAFPAYDKPLFVN